MDTDPVAARKRELRTALRARRRARYDGADGASLRSDEARQLVDRAAPVIARIEALIRKAHDATAGASRGAERPLVAAYHPTPTEADVMPLATRLAEIGADLIFPAAAGPEHLDWIRWDGRSPFVDSPGRGFGKEPAGVRTGPDTLSRASLVLTPAVAVDRSGTRIGHGAGYYDRALAHVPDTCEVIAVVHPTELLAADTLPRTEHDVPIPTVLTADGLVCLVTIDGVDAPPAPFRP